ncbi:hypothetical protein ABZ626_22095 [Streptomyces longispororuber]|uniref:hypothetical protein n=1 Tax=Streptomyces longispororuber TaxID=68230 RepID=UPI0033F9FB3C
MIESSGREPARTHALAGECEGEGVRTADAEAGRLRQGPPRGAGPADPAEPDRLLPGAP